VGPIIPKFGCCSRTRFVLVVVREDMDKDEEKSCLKCEKWRDELINSNPKIIFLLKHLSFLKPAPLSQLDPISSGISFPQVKDPNPDHPNLPVPIFCGPCPPIASGGYQSGKGILICANRILSKTHLENTLAHELIHAWDERRFDWKEWNKDKLGKDQLLRMHACTEVGSQSLAFTVAEGSVLLF
jgi:mitochondrial inner membrane protease ATP23